VTSTLLVLDPDSRRVRVASAGHMAPLVRRADGTVVELAVSRTPPLGVNEAVVYSTRDYSLAVGDTVVLYTDGISEAQDKGGALLGDDRLIDAMAIAEGKPEEVLRSVMKAVDDFAGNEPQADDITLICFGPVGARSVDSTWRATQPARPA
jgi:serine phosphatase RsbU (regulator of sigma subunit)